MMAVGLGFVYLAITRGREPYVLMPIGIGIILTNLPETALTAFTPEESGVFGIVLYYGLEHWDILPPLIFLGLGALTDFGPVIANPKTLLLGAAAQVGIFVAFWGALATGRFDVGEAASIGIIGGADGPDDDLPLGHPGARDTRDHRRRGLHLHGERRLHTAAAHEADDHGQRARHSDAADA